MSTNIRVLHTSHTEVTNYADTDDEWDQDDTLTHTHVTGIAPVSEAEYYDLPVGFSIEPGVTYYLLWARYDTGDTFHDADGQVEWIALYTHREIAERMEAKLRKHYEDKKEAEYSISLLMQTESAWFEPFDFSVPWIGYFESLNDIYVEEVSWDGT